MANKLLKPKDSGKTKKPGATLMLNLVTIELLIGLYYNSNVTLDNMSPAAHSALKWLFNMGMVDQEKGITEKGKFWIDYIKKIPLPVQVEAFEIPDHPES